MPVYRYNYYIRKLQIKRREAIYNRYVLGRNYQEKVQVRLNTLYQTVNQFLQEIDVDYWLLFGTLLGCVRDQKLIVADGDIDFGAPQEAYQKIIENATKLPKGFNIYDSSHVNWGPKVYILWRGWYADIDFYREIDGHLQTCWRTDKEAYRKPVPKDFIYPIQSTMFLKELTKIPHQSDAFLNHTYNYIGIEGYEDVKTGYWYKRTPDGV